MANTSSSIDSGNVEYIGSYTNPQNNKPTEPINTADLTSAKYSTFFNKNYANILRKSNFNMTVKYGANEQVSKTIKNVILRNVTEEVDASGNPVFQVFEFIAEDII